MTYFQGSNAPSSLSYMKITSLRRSRSAIAKEMRVGSYLNIVDIDASLMEEIRIIISFSSSLSILSFILFSYLSSQLN